MFCPSQGSVHPTGVLHLCLSRLRDWNKGIIERYCISSMGADNGPSTILVSAIIRGSVCLVGVIRIWYCFADGTDERKRARHGDSGVNA
jgi:hypothetical protein